MHPPPMAHPGPSHNKTTPKCKSTYPTCALHSAYRICVQYLTVGFRVLACVTVKHWRVFAHAQITSYMWLLKIQYNLDMHNYAVDNLYLLASYVCTWAESTGLSSHTR